jgi:isoleucyl-tRNA synthetase
MFESVSPKLNVNQMELAILQFWQEKNIFKKTTESREGGPEYVFYEGPPTANGKPGVHHALARAFKDLFPRYKVMQGYHISRRGGWDTHGLPVEIEVEKKLGFTNKRQIEEYGIEKFNELCRESAFEYIGEWEKFTDRLGYWVDMDTAYVTYKNDYIESVWNILKKFWDQDLLYQGHRVVPYCPRCGTPLSDHEVAQGYKDAVDPSIFVRFPLVDEENTYFMVWTTTPWTLPGNVALAVNPEEEYIKVEKNNEEGQLENIIIAKSLAEKVFGEEAFKVVEEFKGSKLRGKKYHPLYKFLPLESEAHYVVMQDFVSMEDGTGIVHMAPAFGAEDMNAAREFDLPILMTVKPDGTFIQEVRPWSGKFVKDADPEIIQELQNRGLMYRSEKTTHTYPFCWRCASPLLYYARSTWFIRTSEYKDKLVSLNQKINWVPNHIKDGRFGNWLENNIDWSLGRERFWGTPLPVWECKKCHHQECFGSVEELSKLTSEELSDLDLHRPHVDNLVLDCPKCNQHSMNRVPELIDVWFDSGAMPYAQWHYPFENQETFSNQFPADYICEAVDQTRGWFYSLHAISTLLNDDIAFKNVICLGLILDEDGFKMSKTKGNIVNPWEVLDSQGADAFRWYLYTASPPGNSRRFSTQLVEEVVKNFTLTLWNTLSFFMTYAELDGWTPDSSIAPEYNSLDKWLLSSLNALVKGVTESYEKYDVVGATRPIEGFINDLSNWYLRRSRRRFWKSDSDGDKTAAYNTLYKALSTVTLLLAPSMPFLAEELFQKLVVAVDENAPESVHMAIWPKYDDSKIDETLNSEMKLVMKMASLGHAARNKAEIKVRQPLAEVAFSVGSAHEARAIEKYSEMFMGELNVKAVRALGSSGEAITYTLNPLPRQLGSKYQQKFPQVRKAILAIDGDVAGRKLLAEESIEVVIDGETLTILPEEVEVRADAKSGLVVATDGAYLAALSTELTPALRNEGLVREFVRRVQDLRKQADFEISDRIDVVYQASDILAGAIAEFGDYIKGEVLAISIKDAEISGEYFSQDEPFTFDGENVSIGVKKE